MSTTLAICLLFCSTLLKLAIFIPQYLLLFLLPVIVDMLRQLSLLNYTVSFLRQSKCKNMWDGSRALKILYRGLEWRFWWRWGNFDCLKGWWCFLFCFILFSICWYFQPPDCFTIFVCICFCIYRYGLMIVF